VGQPGLDLALQGLGLLDRVLGRGELGLGLGQAPLEHRQLGQQVRGLAHDLAVAVDQLDLLGRQLVADEVVLGIALVGHRRRGGGRRVGGLVGGGGRRGGGRRRRGRGGAGAGGRLGGRRRRLGRRGGRALARQRAGAG